jgi:predicted RND superfamily exporter protein
MKFAVTLAVIALINNTQAVNIKFNADVEDLFNDDSQEAETLKSISEAEKLHGKVLPASIADENLKEILV